jgi:HAD superfamily hydrolase (TIGR01484 family)
MQIQVNTDHTIEGHETLAARVRGVVENALSRMSDHITRVEVHLIDESGPKSRKNNKRTLAEAGYKVARVWGEVIEDRFSQITFSALGQQAPLEEKDKWDPDYAKRKKIKAILDAYIPEFSVRLGGSTSIDITKPGIDKAYGIGKLRDLLHISLKEMIYIGDALFPGGNDYPVEEAGVDSIPVKGPDETKRVIQAIIACLADRDQGA